MAGSCAGTVRLSVKARSSAATGAPLAITIRFSSGAVYIGCVYGLERMRWPWVEQSDAAKSISGQVLPIDNDRQRA
jgi:hypothetical protein